MDYGRQFDPTIPIVQEGVQFDGGLGEDSDGESEVYSSPTAFLRSLPQDQLDDELRRCVQADDEIKAEQKKIWVQEWLSKLY